MSKIYFFDHATEEKSPFRQLAGERGLREIPRVPGQQDKKIIQGFVEKRRSAAERAVFVHCDQDAWEYLCQQAHDMLLVRLSENERRLTHASDLAKRRMNCVKLLQDLNSAEFGKFIEVVDDSASEGDFLAGRVPSPLRDLVRSRAPHYMRALHILLQAILASFTLNETPDESKRAMELLQVDRPMRITAPARLGQCGHLRECLGLDADECASAAERLGKGECSIRIAEVGDGIVHVLLEEWPALRWCELPEQLKYCWGKILSGSGPEPLEFEQLCGAFEELQKHGLA